MYIKTWNELLSEIKKYKNTLPPKTELWYRGHGNSNYQLLPSLLRYKNAVSKEKDIFEIYRKLSKNYFSVHRNEWDILIDMQQNFIPTRLLDWTENLGIAMFFAVSNNYNESDISLYILNPYDLNKNMGIDDILIVSGENVQLSYTGNFINRSSYIPRFPVAIKSNINNNRVIAQRSMFTIHGKDFSPLEDLCPNSVQKFTISKLAIPEINDFLDIANINEFTVFPDMYGVSSYIRNIITGD